MDNFSYLFWAYVIFWALLFVYVFSLFRKNKSLRREIDALKESFNKGREEKLTWQKQMTK
jgi:CcmD family protein